MKQLAQGFNTAAPDLNQGSCSQDSEALPLSHLRSVKEYTISYEITSLCFFAYT